jgi:maltose alpha-D-glucosyltransferase/alpha-amylase
LRVLVLFHGWKSFFPDQVEPGRRALAEALHQRLIRDVLPEFLPTQRWFAGKGGRIERVEFDRYDVWVEQTEWVLARIRVWLVDRPEPQDYGLPLALAWEDEGEDKLRPLAAPRPGPGPGSRQNGPAVRRLRQRAVRPSPGEDDRARRPDSAGERLAAIHRDPRLRRSGPATTRSRCRSGGLALDSSNTTLNVGARMLLKGYRRLRPGINPELEMGRFLTEAGFANAAPLAGGLEYEDEAGEVIALALLQGFVANQGDAWSYTQDYLRRFLDDGRPPGDATTGGRRQDAHASYRLFAATLGRRTGELHRALAQTTGDPAFDPEPITANDAAEWLDRVREEAKATFERLERARHRLPESAQALAEDVLAAGIGVPHAGRYASLAAQVLDSRGTAAARAKQIEALTPQAMKTRYHGDYHLGQVLVAKDDVIIIDFEGEPSRSLAERRAKHSPLRDVVGMLRSFDYAAHAALRQATADGTCNRAELWPYLGDWEQQSRAAFLDGYVAAVGDSPGYPADPDQMKVLLALFTLEKACYELRYELDNRPDWVEIPLGGLRELLSLEAKDAPS